MMFGLEGERGEIEVCAVKRLLSVFFVGSGSETAAAADAGMLLLLLLFSP